MMIDPPSPFDTLETWQDFLREMERLLKANPQAREAISAEIGNAKQVIESLQRKKSA